MLYLFDDMAFMGRLVVWALVKGEKMFWVVGNYLGHVLVPIHGRIIGDMLYLFDDMALMGRLVVRS